jgi:hypothetical protein
MSGFCGKLFPILWRINKDFVISVKHSVLSVVRLAQHSPLLCAFEVKIVSHPTQNPDLRAQ